MRLLTSTLVVLGFSLLVGLPVIAQDEGNLADSWIVTTKQGQSDKFEAAFKKHMAVRIKKGDPRSWEVFEPAIGRDLDHYVIRTCCITWADLDSYDKWVAKTKIVDDWNKNVDRYVESYAHEIDTIDFNNSNWQDDSVAPALVSFTQYLLKPGREVQWSLAMAAMSKYAMEGKWPYNWAWGEALGGAGERWLAVPYDNYAAMEPSDLTFAKFLSKQMDSREAAMELLGEFSDAIQQTDRTIYRFRADLSTPAGD